MNFHALYSSRRKLALWLVSTVVVPCVLAVIPLLGSYYDAVGTAIVLLLLLAAIGSVIAFVGVVFGGWRFRRKLFARHGRRGISADTLIMAVSPTSSGVEKLDRVSSKEDLYDNTVWLGTALHFLIGDQIRASRVGFLVSTAAHSTAVAYANVLEKAWGISVEIAHVDLGREGDPEHLRKRVDELFESMGAAERGDGVVVDVTGGTKPMSIALHDRAVETGLTVSYVESDPRNGGPDTTTSRLLLWKDGKLVHSTQRPA